MNLEPGSGTAETPKMHRVGWLIRGLLFELAVEKFVKGGGATRPSEKRSKITQHKDGMITVELRNAAGWLATYQSSGEEWWTLMDVEDCKR